MHVGIADMVAPVTYAVAAAQSGYVMRGYKARPPVDAHHGVVAMLTLLALSRHASCSGAIVGVPVTHWASVPSLPAEIRRASISSHRKWLFPRHRGAAHRCGEFFEYTCS